MPFTPAHAVVALPFVRSPLLPAAIAVGAMTPDLPLFLRGIGLGYGFTHEPTNVVWTAVVAAALLVLWWTVLRPAATSLAPTAVAERLPASWRLTGLHALRDAVKPHPAILRVILIALALMIGVLSHIVWDAFTHAGRPGVELIPALAQMWGPLPGYKWLQHGSSVAGLLIIGVFAARWFFARPRVATPPALPTWVRWAWYLSLPVVLCAAVAWGMLAYGPFTDAFTPQHLAYRTMPAAVGVWGAGTVLLCIGTLFVRRQEHSVPGQG